MHIRKIHDQLFFYDAKDHASQNGAPNSTDTSNDGHQEDGNSCLESKDAAWSAAGVDEYGVACMKRAGNSSESGSNGMYPQLRLIGIHAQRCGCVFILLDGAQGQS